MEGVVIGHDKKGLNLKATELRLGLPGRDESEEEMASPASKSSNKRGSPETVTEGATTKAQIVGWPPVRSYRKNNLVPEKKKTEVNSESGIYVKVSMDGAPYLRKIDLKVYNGYAELLKALETMFKLTIGEYNEREGYKGSEYAPAYEDKDGDLMLVGDVPWEMFKSSCKRLRIMKGSEARGLGCGV